MLSSKKSLLQEANYMNRLLDRSRAYESSDLDDKVSVSSSARLLDKDNESPGRNSLSYPVDTRHNEQYPLKLVHIGSKITLYQQ